LNSSGVTRSTIFRNARATSRIAKGWGGLTTAGVSVGVSTVFTVRDRARIVQRIRIPPRDSKPLESYSRLSTYGRASRHVFNSITSFYTNPFNASYGASKAAEWSLTNGVRLELHHQGTLVVAVHAGFIDTDMAALVDAPKISPGSVARQAFDAVEAGQVEVLADERTRTVKASLSRDHELIYPPVQEFWDEAVKGTS
jgi:NAD(P)-dependent dehydrogenase (short-subunit alcohol dehydrogenase family)